MDLQEMQSTIRNLIEGIKDLRSKQRSSFNLVEGTSDDTAWLAEENFAIVETKLSEAEFTTSMLSLLLTPEMWEGLKIADELSHLDSTEEETLYLDLAATGSSDNVEEKSAADPLHGVTDSFPEEADPLHEGADLLHEKADLLPEGTDPLHGGTDPLHEGPATRHEEADPLHEGTATSHEEAGPRHEEAGPHHEEAGPLHKEADPLQQKIDPSVDLIPDDELVELKDMFATLASSSSKVAQFIRMADTLHKSVLAKLAQGNTKAAMKECKQGFAAIENVKPNKVYYEKISNTLSITFSCKGEYKQAIQILRGVLTSRQKRLGDDHHAVAVTLNNLAVLYAKKGNYMDEEQSCQRSLEIKEKCFGSESLAVAKQLYNMAALYQNQKKYGDADQYYERALKVHQDQLGLTNPITMRTRDNLATCKRHQGKFEEGKELYIKIMKDVDPRETKKFQKSFKSFKATL